MPSAPLTRRLEELPEAGFGGAAAAVLPGPGGLLREVRDFLEGLRRDLPSVFGPRQRGGPGRLEARGVLAARAEHWGRVMEVAFRRVAVKDQRTLWGSCSARGNLNFNWRLVLAPPEVLDYVVIHELAHLKVMDHSRRFWETVERYCPEHRARRRWLRLNSRSLRRGGR